MPVLPRPTEVVIVIIVIVIIAMGRVVSCIVFVLSDESQCKPFRTDNPLCRSANSQLALSPCRPDADRCGTACYAKDFVTLLWPEQSPSRRQGDGTTMHSIVCHCCRQKLMGADEGASEKAARHRRDFVTKTAMNSTKYNFVLFMFLYCLCVCSWSYSCSCSCSFPQATAHPASYRLLNKQPYTKQATAQQKLPPHTKQAAAYQNRYRTPNELPHTKPATAHQTSYCTPNKLPHTKQATAHQASDRTPNKLPRNQQATVHRKSYRTPNKLPHTNRDTAHPKEIPHTKQATAHLTSNHTPSKPPQASAD